MTRVLALKVLPMNTIHVLMVSLALLVLCAAAVPAPARAAALSSAQIQSIVSLLQAFGASGDVVNNVVSALQGGSSGGSGTSGGVQLFAYPTYGAAPLGVDFQVNNYKPKGGEVIHFGDGAYTALGYKTATDASHVYRQPGTFVATLHKGGTKGEEIARTWITVTSDAPRQTNPVRIYEFGIEGSHTIHKGKEVVFKWRSNLSQDDISYYGGFCAILGKTVSNREINIRLPYVSKKTELVTYVPEETASYRLFCTSGAKDGSPSAWSEPVRVEVLGSNTLLLEASPTYGPAPLTVTFSNNVPAMRSPNEGEYLIYFGDGTRVAPAPCYAPLDYCERPGTNKHTYKQAGRYIVQLVKERISAATVFPPEVLERSVLESLTVEVTSQDISPNLSPACTIRASKTKVAAGEPYTISWTTTNIENPIMHERRKGGGDYPVAKSGSLAFSTSYAGTDTYSIGTELGSYKPVCSVSVTAIESDPTVNAPTCLITSNKKTVKAGESFKLTWSSKHATSIEGQGVSADKLNGSMEVATDMVGTYEYPLIVYGPGGRGTCAVRVQVTPTSSGSIQPNISFTAAPTRIEKGGQSKLVWSVSGASKCALKTGDRVESVRLSDTRTVTPAETTAYRLTCANASGGGSAEKTVVVAVANTPAPTCMLKASREHIKKGDSVTLSWTSTNADYASKQGGGYGPAQGSITLKPTVSKTYVKTVYGKGGSAKCTVQVKVDNGTFNNRQETVYEGNVASRILAAIASVPNTFTARLFAPSSLGSENPEDDAEAARETFGEENVQITLTADDTTPSCVLSANKTFVSAGDTVTLTWASVNATHASMPGGNVGPANGSLDVVVTQTTTYQKRVFGPEGEGTCTATVEVVSDEAHETELVRSGGVLMQIASAVAAPGEYLLAQLFGPRNTDSKFFHLLQKRRSEQAEVNTKHASTTPERGQNDVPPGLKKNTFPGASRCAFMIRNLKRGMRGDDIRDLQEYLRSTGDLTEEASGYFGAKTEEALKKIQARHNIVSSGSAETTGFGALGPKTRHLLMQRCKELLERKKDTPRATSTAEVVAPSCTLTPSKGEVSAGEAVTLAWESTNATYASMPGGDKGPARGSLEVTVNETTTYLKRVYGPGGEGSCTATVVVEGDTSEPEQRQVRKGALDGVFASVGHTLAAAVVAYFDFFGVKF